MDAPDALPPGRSNQKGMSDAGPPASAGKTIAHGFLEDLITPKLDPGKACLIVIRGRSVGQVIELHDAPVCLGRAPDVELQIEDGAVSRRHAQIERGADGYVIRDLGSTNGVWVNGVRVERHVLRDADRIQIGTSTIVKFCFQDEVEAAFQKKLYDSATRDALTGAYNRRFFLETLEVDFGYASRNGTALSVLLIDLDHFKDVNDRYGHLAGDQVLKECAQIIGRALRAEDISARYGGEEFAVLLRFTDNPRAFAVAERIRGAMEACTFEHDGARLQVTASIGVASLEGKNYASTKELIDAADQFLYRAKGEGRNRVMYLGLEVGEMSPTADTLNIKTAEIQPLPEARDGSDPAPPRARRRRPIGARPPRRRRPT
jgi:diguanylate cyclase (GGDEF)-like protein